ncbi:MAG: hypothetical protein AAF696_26470 [Bacteroidota bacterium]
MLEQLTVLCCREVRPRAEGEAEDAELFKDPEMLRRLREIQQLPDEDRKCILYNIDAVLRDVKTRKAYA